MTGDLGVAAAAAVDVGQRGDRRTDEASLPARRAVDELLELGPAVGLGDDALAVRMGQRVDRDPVAGLARGATEELPGPLRLDGERPLEEAEGEPAGLELSLPEQAIGKEQQRGRPVLLRRVAEAALDGGQERPADAVDGADAGRDPLLAGEVLRVGEAGAGRAVRAVAKASGSFDRSASAAPRASAPSRRAATKATARAVTSLRVGAVDHGAGPST